MPAPKTAERKLVDKAQGYVTEVTYPFNYYRDLNPNIQSLAAIGAGLMPAVQAGAAYTYIEMGCGCGLSTLIHAAANPQSRFIGIDINPEHIALARGLAAAAGLDNVDFRDLAFEDLRAAKLPEVDIIAMHGVWSWINPENRALILDFAATNLKTGGAFYLSYNAMPGTASVMPLRELMMIGFRTTPGAVADKVGAGLALAHAARQAGAAFFRANPLVSQYLDDISPLERNYLAHEYFNADWWAFHHREIVQQLAPLGLRYAASTNVMDNMEQLTLTSEMREQVLHIHGPVDRETLKDFFLNRQFRRDVFLRSPTALADASATLHQVPFVAAVLAANTDRIAASTILGDLRPAPDVTRAIVSVLNEGAASTADLLRRPIVAAFDPGIVFETILTLAAFGALEPALPTATLAARKGRVDRLNVLLWERSLAGHTVNATAAAVTGGAVGLSRAEQIFLLARHRGVDPVELVASVMPEQKRDNIASAYAAFAAGRIGLLRILGIG